MIDLRMVVAASDCAVDFSRTKATRAAAWPTDLRPSLGGLVRQRDDDSNGDGPEAVAGALIRAVFTVASPFLVD